MATHRALKAVLTASLIFAVSCGPVSVTEAGPPTEPQKPDFTEVISSPEPAATTVDSTQNAATTEPTRMNTPATTKSYSQDSIFFPKQKGPQRGSMATVGSGRLILTGNGCLRLKTLEGEPSALLIWPPDYSLNAEGNRVRVLNANGQVVAEVGNYVKVGGGRLSSLNVEIIPESLRRKLPERCSPPYHAVGDKVSVVTK